MYNISIFKLNEYFIFFILGLKRDEQISNNKFN